jgi:hypothetical protein
VNVLSDVNLWPQSTQRAMKATTVAVLGLLLVCAAFLPAVHAGSSSGSRPSKPSSRKPSQSSGSSTSTSAVVRCCRVSQCRLSSDTCATVLLPYPSTGNWHTNLCLPRLQAAGGSSGSDSINSTTVTADPVAVISTHILAGLQVWASVKQ